MDSDKNNELQETAIRPGDIYDKHDVYDKDIAPLLEEVKKVCIANKMPFASMCAVENASDATAFENVFIGTGFLDVNLNDDRFVKFLMLLRGAKVVLPSQSRENDLISIDMASLSPDEDVQPEISRDSENGIPIVFDGELDPKKIR